MASRRCDSCLVRWPNRTGLINCPTCDTLTCFDTGVADKTREELDQALWVRGRVEPKPLPSEELGRLEREWQALEAEAAKRGCWSVADLIADGFPSGHGC